MRFYLESRFDRISALSKEDLLKLWQFENEFFLWPWKKEDWQNLEGSYYFGRVFCGDELYGFSLWEKHEWDNVAHLHKIIVTPKMRSKRLGLFLMQRAQEFFNQNGAHSLYLEVQVLNAQAVSFYEKFGFETLCLKKAFYRDGSDAFAMQKKLS